MQTDLLGRPLPASPPPGGPRPGQWVRLRLPDEQMARARAMGAHCARDGSLVAIWVPDHTTPGVVLTLPGQAPREMGGQWQPARFQLVDARGLNLSYGLRDPATGRVEERQAFVLPGADVTALEPVEHVADLPPHRKFHGRWLERHGGAGRLDDALHAAAGGEFTPAEMIALLSPPGGK